MKKYIVKLAKEERAFLSKLIAQGQASARKLMHARILLKADSSEDGPGWTDQAISEALEIGTATVERVRQRLVEEGVAAALTRHRPHTPRLRKLDGEQEAHLIALVCSQPEEGQERWTLQLLADKLVQLHLVESISRETIRQVLEHNELKPWLNKQWCIPPKNNAEFVCQMEEVLSVYTRPYDERRPQVCLDETSKQLVSETRVPLPLQPGQPECCDYEYERQGTCNLFVACEPLVGKRYLQVTEQRTKVDFARFIRDLVDVYYPAAEKIVLVMDNLNTHTPAALYEVFEPAEARRLIEKLELHSTPKHGSWLNMAEIEFSVLTRQCLHRRIGSRTELEREVVAWQAKRNGQAVGINWRFTTTDARIKLKHLYPSIAD
ncbi:MAG: IS630 family transposase [Ktedonobacteraceae bacterium]